MFLKKIMWMIIGLSLMGCSAEHDSSHSKESLSYPTTKAVDQVDDYHGTSVQDPYRWLEQDDTDTQTWVKSQQAFSEQYLTALPGRDTIEKKLTQAFNFTTYQRPMISKGRYIYFKNDGRQNQPILYLKESPTAKERLLIDPNTLSDDGTRSINDTIKISPNGQFLAYGVQDSGSDWTTWKVFDISANSTLADEIKWVKFIDVSWDKNSQGFYYGRYAEPTPSQSLQQANYYHKLYYHKLGDDQGQDKLVYERKDQKEWSFEPTVSDDGRYLLIKVSRGTSTKHRFFYQDLTLEGAAIEPLLVEGQASYDFLGNQGALLYFITNDQAPLGKVISVNLADNKSITTLVKAKQESLQEGDVIHEKLVLKYLRDAVSVVQLYDLQGQPIEEVTLPGLGRVEDFNGHIEDQQTLYIFDSYVQAPTVYRYDFLTNKSDIVFASNAQFDSDNYQSEQIFYQSKDGTRIPMIISYKKDMKKSKNTPTKLFGYGGFTVNLIPRFDPVNLTWMDLGGIHAVANLRGGNEYGETWHQAGMLSRKQNVFDDFIYAAQWLIDNGYTQPSKLAIEGRSNGGLLVGATVNQRPDLFAAAIPHVGVMDMLRFHQFTIGWAWVPEYGSSENKAQFATLYDYSPLHNIKSGVDYPAILVTTADHDDRVVPAHSYKYAATLQQSPTGPAPKLIRIDSKAGHGAGKPIGKRIEEFTDVLAFLAQHLSMTI